MTLDLDKLEQVAQAATPGPWKAHLWDRLNDIPPRVDMGHGGRSLKFVGPVSARDEDAEHIAAADPTTVLALIARIRELETGLKEACDLADSTALHARGAADRMQRIAALRALLK